LNRFARIRGHTLCPNLIIAETSLEWPLHDLYSARELCQMIPITGFDVYQKLVQVNDWAGEFLPNAFSSIMSLPKLKVHNTHISQILEYLFGGGIGDRFELWESNRKIARFSRDEKFGEETIFTREVCQGNFHHHRKWTRELFDEKMRGVDASLEREFPTIRPQLQSF